MHQLIEKFKLYGPKRFFSYAFAEISHKIVNERFRKSFSQCGEDLIIDELLGHKPDGFYLDVGANDPNRYSNTKRFYLKGWRGINLEPDHDNFQKFVRQRPRDINLNMGAAESSSELEFYKFMPDGLSTFCKEEVNRYLSQGYKIQQTFQIHVKTLAEILAEHLPNTQIDFMSVDTEGFDMQVLKGNDWSRFSPTLICIESVIHTIDGKNNQKNDQHDEYLRSLGYKKVADTSLNSIYKLQKNGTSNLN